MKFAKKNMIIQHNFASDILERIEDELMDYWELNGIEVRDTSISKLQPNFEQLRKFQYYSLPILSRGSTEVIQLYKEYHEISTSNWVKEHPKLVKNSIKETIKSLFETEAAIDSIRMGIYQKISNLINEYDLVLESTKESNRLFGIENEEKILLIHLNRYIEILNSDTEQIKVFEGVVLNKKISDLVLEIYVRFINFRLQMLNPNLPKENSQKHRQLAKILWKGSQRDLLELFVELNNKGWIEDFKYGEFKKTADSISNLFDLTLTKKGDSSDPRNSFYQILKGVHNKQTKKREYDEILGIEKDRKFNYIKENGC